LAGGERRRQDFAGDNQDGRRHPIAATVKPRSSRRTRRPRRRQKEVQEFLLRDLRVLRGYGWRNELAPGCVPAMNASVIEPGASDDSTAPFCLSTARKTMFPGASNSGGSSLSGRVSM